MTDVLEASARARSLYDEDPYAWSLQQADALRALAEGRRQASLDLPHLIEELDGMAASDRRAVESLAARIMEHFLLIEHSPAVEPRRGWQAEIVTVRQELDSRLTATLRQHLAGALDRVYGRARNGLAKKLAIYGEEEVAARLPAELPYTLEQITGEWLPNQP